MKKILKIILAFLAGIVALSYILGYDYLFKGISKTYLRGKTGASIDDAKFFKSNTIASAEPKIWEKDSLYNKKPLPENILKSLKKSNAASFLVVKNGKLLHEEYWDGFTARTKTNSFSMAKTVTVMLLGKAIEEGKIKSLNQNFSDFYDNYANVEHGKNLTLRDLAAMEAGLDWDEDYKNPFKPNAKAYYGNSLEKAVFYRKFKEEPGKRFEYQSGATQLLGFAIGKSLDQSLASYLSDKFWKPLGMESSADWSTDQFGVEKTFCCIHGIPRDFAKLGQFFLDGGKVNGVQLLNKKFINQMITPTKVSNGIYGLGFWINNDNPIKHYFFQGHQGQNIIIIPEKQMVIVKTGSFADQPKNDNGRPDQVRFLVNEISKYF